MAGEDLLDGRALVRAEPLIVVLDGLPGFHADEGWLRVLAGEHHVDRLALQGDHFRCGERAGGRPWVGFDLDEFGGSDTPLELRLDRGDRHFAHRPLQRIAQHGAFVDDGVTLDVSFPGIRDGCLADRGQLNLDEARAARLCGLYGPGGLLAERRGHLAMPTLHRLMRVLDLGFARLMRGDLCGASTSPTLPLEVVLDLLPTRTRRVEIRLCVAADFRLTTRSALDLVAQRPEAHGELRSIHGGRKLLAAVQLPRLHRPCRSGLGLREIEDDRIRMELGSRVTVDGPRAVVLEGGGNPLSGRLGWTVATHTGLDVALGLAEGHDDTRAMGVADPIVAGDDRRERHALGGRERGVPPCAMLHRLRRLAALIGVAMRRL